MFYCVFITKFPAAIGKEPITTFISADEKRRKYTIPGLYHKFTLFPEQSHFVWSYNARNLFLNRKIILGRTSALKCPRFSCGLQTLSLWYPINQATHNFRSL